ncbi:hypothetical protein COX24_00260 [bacterium (Candidatus Gribaldobacteria) CG23_combo_of_CG06-09_8_20_14_all_37_87_8]|nr:MAG: hypothetical protein COX24_00260 [bacterium (Candidatus Gribaldobacteria) CG23_combo_of_CG06-09_8_20_14_all_37_87_8]
MTCLLNIISQAGIPLLLILGGFPKARWQDLLWLIPAQILFWIGIAITIGRIKEKTISANKDIIVAVLISLPAILTTTFFILWKPGIAIVPVFSLGILNLLYKRRP